MIIKAIEMKSLRDQWTRSPSGKRDNKRKVIGK